MHVAAIVSASHNTTATTPAAGGNAGPVDKLVDELIDGDVLDVGAEDKLIKAGWK